MPEAYLELYQPYTPQNWALITRTLSSCTIRGSKDDKQIYWYLLSLPPVPFPQFATSLSQGCPQKFLVQFAVTVF